MGCPQFEPTMYRGTEGDAAHRFRFFDKREV
jgi:hypothetical protein